MSLTKIWAPHFQSVIRMRGRAYQGDGRVTRLPPEAGEMVRAEVRGENSTYTVIIEGDERNARPQCTCPLFAKGQYCKHIWATILDVQYNPISDDEPTEAGAMDNAPPPAPKARRRSDSPAATSTRRTEPEWVSRLTLLRPWAADRQALEPLMPAARQVCYVVSYEHSIQNGGLVVLLRQRQPTQTGWSRFRRMRMSAELLRELEDPIDRELCALVIGGRYVDHDPDITRDVHEPTHDAFRLPRDAQRSLLRRMIETGRCYFEHDSTQMPGEPLQWDDGETWTLCMVGDRTDDGLRIHVELRRSGYERQAISWPELLLTGHEGLLFTRDTAATFDDHGAGRWATHFRDEIARQGDDWAIDVPAADIPRFVERLYTMSQLPEIDLPEDLGPAELRLQPQPAMELFSPAALGTNGVAVPKSQLLARISFNYGDHVVRLGEASRFISTGRIVVDDSLDDGDNSDDTLNPDADAEAVDGLDAPGADDADSDIFVHEEAEHGSNGNGGESQHATATDDGAVAVSDADDDTDDEAVEADDSDELIDQNEDEEPTFVTAEDGSPLMIRREMEAERKCLGILASLGFRHQPNHGPDTLLLPAALMPNAVSALLERGWRVAADQRVVHHAGPPRLSITSGVDWFELHGQVTFDTADGPRSISLPDLLAASRSGKHMIDLGNGATGLLPQEWLEQHGLLTAIGKSHGDHLRFRSGQAALLDALLDGQEMVSVDDQFAEARQQLKQFDGITAETPAESFKGQLRHYQAEGLGWMHFLNRFAMGGVLADDMGLGKTVQVLAMLDRHYTELRASGAEHKPSLIVAPRSVVFNWLDEAAKFAPQLRLQAYTGSDREALRAAFIDHDIIITSFGLMRRDIDELREHIFEYVVLDEAQAIKNPSSQAAKAARVLEANHRLALTGTPVENHLGDLWSIFEFLNPGMLGSNTGFGKLIRATDPRGRRDTNVMSPDGELRRAPVKAEATVQIARALKPFILRRTKSQVLTELPEKTEQTIICELEPEQRRLYDQLRVHYRDELLSRGGAGNAMGNGSSMVVLEALLRLRQAACHPGLIDDRRVDEPSAKMTALLERLEDLIDEGHKALVFSQFTSMLAIVRRQLDARGIAYEYLDGQTRERRKAVARFQTDPKCPLFLISLKAGGLGLNLTAAEYVFILDPWWNPAVEAQAIDRTHRIGQTQRVFAYRLIAEHTVEQRILELQDRKRELADAIVGGQENILRSLTREDLEQLLS